MNKKGQANPFSVLATVVFLFCILVVLSQVLPAFLDNHIGPAIQNRQTGIIGIFTYNLMFPVFILAVIALMWIYLTRG